MSLVPRDAHSQENLAKAWDGCEVQVEAVQERRVLIQLTFDRPLGHFPNGL